MSKAKSVFTYLFIAVLAVEALNFYFAPRTFQTYIKSGITMVAMQRKLEAVYRIEGEKVLVEQYCAKPIHRFGFYFGCILVHGNGRELYVWDYENGSDLLWTLERAKDPGIFNGKIIDLYLWRNLPLEDNHDPLPRPIEIAHSQLTPRLVE